MPYKKTAKSSKPVKSSKPAKRYSKSYSKSYVRKAPVDHGPSKYLATGLSTLGGMIGANLAGPPGALAGFTAGALVGDTIRDITGYGDYHVQSNTLVMGQPPGVRNSARPGGSIILSHKEYIGDVVSSSSANTFKIETFPINPGVDKTFPWLSQVASNFQEYSIRGMVFHFRSMSADALNSTNTALGSVILATQYNAAEPAFTSKSEMENAQFSNSIKPSQSCLHLIECARSSSVLSNLYVRSDAVDSSSQDIRFYDLGNFSIASTGCQGTSVNLGELWVSFELELMRPKLYAELGETIDYYNAYTLTGVTNALPLGTADFVNSDNSNLGVVISASVSSQLVTFPASSAPKSYMIRLFWRGSRTASLDSPALTYTNCNANTNIFVYTSAGAEIQSLQSPDDNANAQSIYLEECVAIQTSGSNKIPTISFGSAGVLPASVVVFNITIMQIPNTYAFTP
ncbi:capsid protein [Crucivirus-97]|nr:capsid protein [Crucivirus-97]